VRLVLGEHYSPAVAEQLQHRGIDAIPVAERKEASRASLRQTPDEDLLLWARQENRVLVTENARDFVPLHRSLLERGETHAGIVLTSPRKYPRRSKSLGLLVNALADLAQRSDPSDTSGRIIWL
jgi:predicted nuclease of predicted toxin-antitoxin system